MAQLSLRNLDLSQTEKDILEKLFITEDQSFLPQLAQLDEYEKGSEKWQQLRCCYLGSSHFQMVRESPDDLLKKYELFTADPTKSFVKDERELEWDNFHLEEDVLKSKHMYCMEGLPFLVCTPDYIAVHKATQTLEYIIHAVFVIDESFLPKTLPRSIQRKVNTACSLLEGHPSVYCIIEHADAICVYIFLTDYIKINNNERLF